MWLCHQPTLKLVMRRSIRILIDLDPTYRFDARPLLLHPQSQGTLHLTCAQLLPYACMQPCAAARLDRPTRSKIKDPNSARALGSFPIRKALHRPYPSKCQHPHAQKDQNAKAKALFLKASKLSFFLIAQYLFSSWCVCARSFCWWLFLLLGLLLGGVWWFLLLSRVVANLKTKKKNYYKKKDI